MLSQVQINHMEKTNKLFWCRQKISRVDNRPFRFKDFPFLIPIYKDRSKRMAIEKSEQMGLTIFGAADSFYHTWLGKNWIIYFPTHALVTKFVQGRYDVLVNYNPGLKSLIQNTDNTTIKKIGQGVIYFSGLGSATAEGGKFEVISIPADGITFDEYEKMHPKKAKDALGRMSKSPDKFERYLSTPGLPNYGINMKFKETDQKYLNIKCSHCNHWNVYDLATTDKPMAEFPQCIEQGFLACLSCKRPVFPSKKMEFVPLRPKVKGFSGYHISGLYYPKLDCVRMLEDFYGLTSTTETKDFVNNRLGLPFMDNAQRITAEEVLSLCGAYRMQDSDDSGLCTMGIDIGGYRKGCHVVITKPGDSTLRKLVWAGIIKDPGVGSEADIEWIFTAVKDFVTRYKIKRFGVDAQPEEMISRALVRRFSGKGWMVRYQDSLKGAYDWREDDDPHEVRVNRTVSLDSSHYLLRKHLLALPFQDKTIEELAAHCANLSRDEVLDPRTGAREYYWKNVGPADFRQAINYDAVMWYDSKAVQKPSAILNLSPDPLYRPSLNRKGGIKLEW